MNPRPPQPPQSPRSLDAEERALAKSLPRLHGRTAPGPDLDATILAAAQAAVRPARPAHSPAQSPARPQVRWIAPAALAASMVLAAGMAWQLRPLPALETAQSTAQSETNDVMAVQMIEPAPSAKAAPMMQSQPAPAESMAPTPQRDNPAIINALEHAPSADAQRGQIPALQAPPPAMPASAPPSALPLPAPPAPPHPAAVMAAEAAPRATSTVPSSAAAASSINALDRSAASTSAAKAGVADSAQQAAAKAVTPQASNEPARAADAGFVDDPGVDIPPATAASPVVRDAWLRRIGELVDQGKRQDAKASLAEFRRRYPTADVPPVLHALETEP